MTRKPGSPEASSDQVVVSVEIGSRNRQIEVTTLRRGSGRHTRYHSLNQVPPELRGEALELIRQAVLNAGYASLAELDAALTSELVVPEAESDEDSESA